MASRRSKKRRRQQEKRETEKLIAEASGDLDLGLDCGDLECPVCYLQLR